MENRHHGVTLDQRARANKRRPPRLFDRRALLRRFVKAESSSSEGKYVSLLAAGPVRLAAVEVRPAAFRPAAVRLRVPDDTRRFEPDFAVLDLLPARDFVACLRAIDHLRVLSLQLAITIRSVKCQAPAISGKPVILPVGNSAPL